MATDVEALVQALDGLAGRKFAVVDAAHFDDLQSLMKGAGFAFRPLYLDEKEEDVAAAGPHLVPLPDRQAARRLCALLGDKPAVVWWSWPDMGDETEDAIFDHLRTINMVEIPVDRDDNPDAGLDVGGAAQARAAMEAEAAASGHGTHAGHDHHNHGSSPVMPPRYELVLLRHADPNVMGMLLPLLDSTQISRLFGEAVGIVADAVGFCGLRDFARPQALPPRPPGWLRIRLEQYEALFERRSVTTSRSTAAYLRKSASARAAHMTDSELEAQASVWLREARERGVQSPAAQRRWCYLQFVSGGALGDNPDIDEAFAEPWGTPDLKVWLMMQHVKAAVHEANRQ